LQFLLGLVLGAAGMVVCLYGGVLVREQPDWRTGAVVLALLAITQWISYFVFRRHIALQVLCGTILCIAIAVPLIYSNYSFFWEVRYPDGSSPITWRSDMALLLLTVITQAISSLAFRRIRLGKRGTREATGTRR